MKRISLSLVVGIVLAGAATVGLASRNSSGTYSPYASPFVSGTSISSATMNGWFSEIGTELTSSLDRGGRGGMLAPLRTPDGSVSAPSVSWNSEPATGLYRIGASNPAMSVSGVKRQEWSTTGTLVNGTLGVSGASTLTGLATLTGGASLGAPITGMTRASLPAVGQQVSSSSGNFTTTSLSAADVTNLTVTITTSGRPVVLALQHSGTSDGWVGKSSTGAGSLSLNLLRGASLLSQTRTASSAGTTLQTPPSLFYVDAPGAGTYTYKVQALTSDATTQVQVTNCVLVAYEL